MELTHLEYFKTIAEYESITLAAEKLYLSPSSLSKTLSRLEKELGCTLFTRAKGHIFLNDDGKLFLKAVTDVFSTLSSSVQALKARQEASSGTVSISVTGFGEFVSQLEQFCPAYPDIRVNHLTLEHQHLRDALLGGTVDFCISCIPLSDEPLTTVPFFSQQVLFVCSRDHPLAERDSVTLEDIRSESFVINKLTGGRVFLDEVDNEYGVRLNTVVEGVSDDLCLALTEQNYGVTLMPIGILLGYFRYGYRDTLRALPITGCQVQMPVYFILRKDKNLSPPAQTLYNFLLSCNGGHQAALERAAAERHWEMAPEAVPAMPPEAP